MVNHKRSYRIYYEENPQVLTGHRKKLQRPKGPIEVPSGPNQRRSMDCVSDHAGSGRGFRVFDVHWGGAKKERPNEKGHTSECCAAIAQNRHQASAV